MKKKKEKQKVTLIKNIIKIYKDLFKIDKLVVFIIIIQSILYAVSPFIMVLLPKYLLDELSLADVRVWIVVLLVVGSAILNLITNGIANYLDLESYPRIERYINRKRIQTRRKICSLDQEDLENPTILDMHSKANQAINNYGIMNLIYNSINQFTNLITLLGCISIIFTLNPLVVIALIIPILLGFINEYVWSKNHKKQQDKLHPIWRRLLYLTDVIIKFQFGKDIRLFGMRKWLIKKYDDSSMEEYRNLKGLWRNNLRNQLGYNLAHLITSLIVYGYLTYSVINKGISIGDYLMYSSAIFTFVNRSTWFLEAFNYMINNNRYVDDFFKFMNYSKEVKQVEYRDINEVKTFDIEFKNVCFKYPNQENYALENINLKIKNNEKLAIVGFNGAGKSTFIKLLTRLYEPTSGEILINNININSYSKEEYYKLYSVVFQDINLYAFSIKENVAMESVDKIDDNKVYDCLAKAGLKDKIDSLEKGINTSLLKNLDEQGIDLSGGEAQKLIFARAIYKDAPFAIFDEPTSALDALAEYNLYNQFNNILKDKTAIYISHRLSSTRFCDKIVMFKNGHVVEEGTHDELILNKKEYFNMFSLQANYYMDKEGDENEN